MGALPADPLGSTAAVATRTDARVCAAAALALKEAYAEAHDSEGGDAAGGAAGSSGAAAARAVGLEAHDSETEMGSEMEDDTEL